jgi:hypothetical protein
MTPLDNLAIDRFTVAAPLLLGTDLRERPRGYSRTLFGGGVAPTQEMLAALAAGAAGAGMDLVYMVFDSAEVASGPMRLMLIQPRDDVHHVTIGCQFWCPADGGRAVIVVSKSKADVYFEFEGAALVQRQGPLPSMFDDDGFDRAADRLCAIAATMPSGQGTVFSVDHPPSA